MFPLEGIPFGKNTTKTQMENAEDKGAQETGQNSEKRVQTGDGNQENGIT
jgi:hypothetical protein